MKLNLITIPSYWGNEVSQKHIMNECSSLVVLFPGKNYPCELPLLYYASKVAIENKHDVLLLEYGYQSARSELNIDQLSMVIDECLLSISKIADQYSEITFISKSLGTVVAGEVAKKMNSNEIKHMFLTPLSKTVPYIMNTNSLVIYGTADDLFEEEDIKMISQQEGVKIVSILDANHALEVSNVKESLVILGNIIQEYEEFLMVCK
jgi:hypothetical protein